MECTGGGKVEHVTLGGIVGSLAVGGIFGLCASMGVFWLLELMNKTISVEGVRWHLRAFSIYGAVLGFLLYLASLSE